MTRSNVFKLLIRSVVLVAVYMFAGCSSGSDVLKPEAWLEWLKDKENGLYSKKTIEFLELEARYIPNAFLAYREFQSDAGGIYDSLAKKYSCGLTYQLILSAIPGQTGSLINYGVTTDAQFQERISILNFKSEEFIRLNYNGSEFKPVLANFEGFDQITNKLTFQVVFNVPELNCAAENLKDDMVLTFQDPFWNSGTNNFRFVKSDIENIPKLSFENK